MRQRERERWMSLLAEDRERNSQALGVLLAEIAKLADRIQHPNVLQVEPGPVVEHELPTDEGELAQVGQIMYGPSENGAADA